MSALRQLHFHNPQITDSGSGITQEAAYRRQCGCGKHKASPLTVRYLNAGFQNQCVIRGEKTTANQNSTRNQFHHHHPHIFIHFLKLLLLPPPPSFPLCWDLDSFWHLGDGHNEPLNLMNPHKVKNPTNALFIALDFIIEESKQWHRANDVPVV